MKAEERIAQPLISTRTGFAPEDLEALPTRVRSIPSDNRIIMKIVTVFAIALVITGRLVSATDWPQWGGTVHRNMYSPAKNLPSRFDLGKSKPGTTEVDLSTARNVKWVAPLGTQSYGN